MKMSKKGEWVRNAGEAEMLARCLAINDIEQWTNLMPIDPRKYKRRPGTKPKS